MDTMNRNKVLQNIARDRKPFVVVQTIAFYRKCILSIKWLSLKRSSFCELKLTKRLYRGK